MKVQFLAQGNNRALDWTDLRLTDYETLMSTSCLLLECLVKNLAEKLSLSDEDHSIHVTNSLPLFSKRTNE